MVFLASECVRPLSKTYLGVFPASKGTQIQEVADRTFPIRLGHIRSKRPIGSKTAYFSIRSTIAIIFTSFGSKKCGWCDFLQPDPSKSGNLTLIDLGENYVTYIVRRERPIFNISGAKAHANVLIPTGMQMETRSSKVFFSNILL